MNETREKVRYKVTSVSISPENEKVVAIEAVCTNSPAAPKWLPRMLEFEVKGSEGRPRVVPQVMGYVEASIDLFPDDDQEDMGDVIHRVIEKEAPGVFVDQESRRIAAEIARELVRRGALR